MPNLVDTEFREVLKHLENGLAMPNRPLDRGTEKPRSTTESNANLKQLSRALEHLAKDPNLTVHAKLSAFREVAREMLLSGFVAKQLRLHYEYLLRAADEMFAMQILFRGIYERAVSLHKQHMPPALYARNLVEGPESIDPFLYPNDVRAIAWVCKVVAAQSNRNAPEQWLTVSAAAKFIDVSPGTISRACARSEIATNDKSYRERRVSRPSVREFGKKLSEKRRTRENAKVGILPAQF